MKIKAIIDHVGHTVIGELVEEDDNKLTLRSPAILHAMPNQQNQLQVQLFPIIFKEFLTGDSKENGAKFFYNKCRIVDTDLELEDKLIQQYKMMFAASNQASGASDTEVVKLFDE